MMLSFRRILAVLAALIFSAATLGGSLAQNSTARYFSETGHWVTGEILAAYESIPNHIRVYGYPITGAFKRATAPGEAEVTYQYFERARFEFRPDQPSDLQVTLSPLGIFLYDQNPPGPVVEAAPGLQACRYFSETGNPVCYTFLEFFDQNGGIAQFGYPISEIEIQEGWMVQYFQRARFEWHPEYQPGERVVLTNVGRMYFDLVEDPNLLLPSKDQRLQTILNLKVQAFVNKAVLSPDELQTLYVIVQDQNSVAIPNAQVTFTLSLPNGKQEQTIMPLTNGDGITTLTFSIAEQTYGVNEIKIMITYDRHQKETVTSYRGWW